MAEFAECYCCRSSKFRWR